ncbi:hypothetical protein [Desmospora activa]|uniref:Uncharacterized protein n=1 Tax=Desmospora activa DSM 45169 TaxID=1121389 RepID=A0A2T4Z902_9BACL|nr:hypothetical protein [Desmospora activa]PTM58359.1 hypothetical protein C8J48_0941 [Desmospora activa DSM 45169]
MTNRINPVKWVTDQHGQVVYLCDGTVLVDMRGVLGSGRNVASAMRDRERNMGRQRKGKRA